MITEHTCYTVECATEGCDPWDEGIPHFPTPDEAVDYARGAGWTVVGDTARCESCSRRADCERTGHQWDAWRACTHNGVPYRTRWCDHCAATEYDPPAEELAALIDAARIINAAASSGEPR